MIFSQTCYDMNAMPEPRPLTILCITTYEKWRFTNGIRSQKAGSPSCRVDLFPREFTGNDPPAAFATSAPTPQAVRPSLRTVSSRQCRELPVRWHGADFHCRRCLLREAHCPQSCGCPACLSTPCFRRYVDHSD